MGSEWPDKQFKTSWRISCGRKRAIRDFGYLSNVAGGVNYTIGNSGVITTGYSNTTLDNPDLRWEETSQTNIGFDAELFRNLTFTMEFFKKSTSGILRPQRRLLWGAASDGHCWQVTADLNQLAGLYLADRA